MDEKFRERVMKKESPQFLKLMEKINEPCDLIAPNDPPFWLDKDLFKNYILLLFN